MIFPPHPLVFVALLPVDLRLGIDKLADIVTRNLRKGVRDGGFFVFLNKRRTKLRILHFDKSGEWLISKRLSAGTFPLPVSLDVRDGCVCVSSAQLRQLLEGVSSARPRRPRRPPPLH